MNFVSESALEEKRRLRQEEWERVRKPDDPIVAPEEEYDSRSLYERLKEQKDKKQQEFDEAHKLKNMVRGLDDDEAGFLDFVDQAKLAEEKRKNKEESEEIEEYRKAVAKEKEERLLTEVKSISSVPQTKQLKPTTIASSIGITNQTQKSHLNAFVVKRKSLESHGSVVKKLKSAEDAAAVHAPPSTSSSNLLKCIAVLPGIGCYGNSSDSDTSSDSDDCLKPSKHDLCGRPVQSPPTEHDE